MNSVVPIYRATGQLAPVEESPRQLSYEFYHRYRQMEVLLFEMRQAVYHDAGNNTSSHSRCRALQAEQEVLKEFASFLRSIEGGTVVAGGYSYRA